MSWLRGIPIRARSNTFQRFNFVSEDYGEFDIGVKNAILKASPTVASLISHIGDKAVFIGSGTIIECENRDGSFFGTVLTSATLLRGPSGTSSVPDNLEIDVHLSDGRLYEGQVLAYDFHHNLALIKIKSITPLSTATMKCIDDSVGVDSMKSAVMRSCSSQHEDAEGASSRFKLCPGELVITLGRYYNEAYEIMAAPGVFSSFNCKCDCKELFSTSCVVTKLAVGGPLVNCHGEVIGINFFACPYNAFLPINIVCKCLEALKKTGEVPRPWLGVGVGNILTANLEILEKLKQKFPHVVKGVIVEEVQGSSNMDRKKVKKKTSIKSRMKRRKKEQKSPASLAGLCTGDVIIRCGGKLVGSHLEFAEALWDKEGKLVELVVLRPNVGEQLKLTVKIETSLQDNRWAVPENDNELLVKFPYQF